MWVCVLFTVITVSSLSITFEDSFAQTSFTITPIDSIDDADNTAFKLDGANAITSFTIGTSTYVAVASEIDSGVQILDVSTPSSISAVSQITDDGTLVLAATYGITSFVIGTSTYVAAVSFTNDGVQILDVSTPSSISAVSQITDDGTLALNGPLGITSFKIGTSTYVAVASSADSGVQILDVSTPSSISAVSQITDDGTLVLAGARGITSFKISTSTYVAVTSANEDGVQILDVSTPGTITPVSQITNDATLALNGAYGITSFVIDTSTYVAVASRADDGVQILDVSTPSSISAVSQITNDATLALNGAIGVTSFKIGTSTYVAVSSYDNDGVQILDVSTPSSISAVSQITDDATHELDGAYGVTSFKIGTSTYVAVASYDDDGSQILQLNVAPTANAGSNKSAVIGTLVTLSGSGSDPDGDTISYSWVKTAGPSVMLSSNTAQNPTFTAPSSVGTITFTLTVSDGTHSTTDTVTITVTTIQNQPPTANAGSNQSVVVDTLVTLSGSGTDPDGDDNNLRYTWKQTSGTPTVTIDDPASARTTFTAPADPTELIFTFTVSDGPDSTTDDITITIKERPTQTRNIKEIDGTIVSAQITAPNQITMIYNEQLSTFINSYLNFTISGEDTPRNMIGVDGSPSKSMVVNIDGDDTNAFVTILTFDGQPVPADSTGTMYMQHTDYYLKFIQVSDGQD